MTILEHTTEALGTLAFFVFITWAVIAWLALPTPNKPAPRCEPGAIVFYDQSGNHNHLYCEHP